MIVSGCGCFNCVFEDHWGWANFFHIYGHLCNSSLVNYLVISLSIFLLGELGFILIDWKDLSLFNILTHILQFFAFLFCSVFLFLIRKIYNCMWSHTSGFFPLPFLLLLCPKKLWALRACTFHPLSSSFSTDTILHSTPSYIWNSFCCVMSGWLWIVLAFMEYSFLSWIDLHLFTYHDHSGWTHKFITCFHIWGEVFPLFYYCFGICLAVYASWASFDKFCQISLGKFSSSGT